MGLPTPTGAPPKFFIYSHNRIFIFDFKLDGLAINFHTKEVVGLT